jgi:hypothetical protein
VESADAKPFWLAFGRLCWVVRQLATQARQRSSWRRVTIPLSLRFRAFSGDSESFILTTPDNMDEYVCFRRDLPRELYRVHYTGSRTSFSSQQGFAASDTTKTFSYGELNEFKQAIEKQFTWSCRESLLFISLFSDKRHAEDWGRKEPWRGHQGPDGDWTLYVIDTVELPGTTQVFRLSDLAEKLSLDIPEVAKQHTVACKTGFTLTSAMKWKYHFPNQVTNQVTLERRCLKWGLTGDVASPCS